MKVGSKSLLFGVHQFIWHPLTVTLAWRRLFKRWPTKEELFCIAVHDLGYWGCSEMNGPEGSAHCEAAAAQFVEPILGARWAQFCERHSRCWAAAHDVKPSALCWADKVSMIYDPWWFYLPRAWLSGELDEYRVDAVKYVPLSASHRAWYRWAQNYCVVKGETGAKIQDRCDTK